eukprot:TRINITY_DN101597_c0_g1_i1.p1 TRINITY_DN101597_c0_g1~~TRINITY_DN101597_c0_g1_i1.p1  ORF type:complete len:478 (+),score=98.94 TRINITY_DN101597_c0_g1_i1:47-1480(+)
MWMWKVIMAASPNVSRSGVNLTDSQPRKRRVMSPAAPAPSAVKGKEGSAEGVGTSAGFKVFAGFCSSVSLPFLCQRQKRGAKTKEHSITTPSSRSISECSSTTISPSSLRDGTCTPESGSEAALKTPLSGSEDAQAKPWFWLAVLTVLFNVGQYIPYNMIVAKDPGSPLFLSFTAYISMVLVNLRHLPQVIRERKLPMKYHFLFVFLGLAFGVLNSNARSLLPGSMCELLRNLQMFLALTLDYVVFNTRQSSKKIFGCFVVVAGVALAGQSTPRAAFGGELDAFSMYSGIAQMIGSLLALTVLVKSVKIAFQKHGEAPGEQILMQHLLALPFFLTPSTWEVVRPRLTTWADGSNNMLLGLLVANVSFTVLHQFSNIKFAGRMPNLMVYNFVDVLKKFLTLFSTALIFAPPLPTAGFWLGAFILLLGSCIFVFASDGATKTGAKADGGLKCIPNLTEESGDAAAELMSSRGGLRRAAA